MNGILEESLHVFRRNNDLVASVQDADRWNTSATYNEESRPSASELEPLICKYLWCHASISN
eukprot:scaffold3008_cov112-Skeletonema_menzelii.AAC.3